LNSFAYISPAEGALIESCANWLIVSSDGYFSLLKNSTGFEKNYRFQHSVVKFLFSSSGNTIYAIDNQGVVWKRSLSQRSIKEEVPEFGFSQLISLPIIPKKLDFFCIVNFEQSIYLIRNGTVHTITNNQFSSSHSLNDSITASHLTNPENLKGFDNISYPAHLPYICLVGTNTGCVAVLSFPDQLEEIFEFSKGFKSKNEPISHIYVSTSGIIIVGQYGLVAFFVPKTKPVVGTVPYPVQSMRIVGNDFIFVAQQKLYSGSLNNISSFSLIAGFPSRIIVSSSHFAYTKSGSVVDISQRTKNCLIPKPEYIEYALQQLNFVAESHEVLQKDLSNVESRLNDIQLLRFIQNGVKTFDTSIELVTNMNPDGRISCVLKLSISPISNNSCKGFIISIILAYSNGFQEIISLPKVVTKSISWSNELQIVSPASFDLYLIFSHCDNNKGDSTISTKHHFDILDFSHKIQYDYVQIGLVSPMHRVIGINHPELLNFELPSGCLPINVESSAYQTPYGEQWTIRIDDKKCYISAGTLSTLLSIKAAILNRSKIPSDSSVFDHSAFDSLLKASESVLQTEFDDSFISTISPKAMAQETSESISKIISPLLQQNNS